jgi:16S rRNA (cytosine967-C5)-methyltransferase
LNFRTAINSRDVAAVIIRRWMEKGEFPDRLMGSVVQDRGFVTELVYGAVKWKRQLEWAVKRCSRSLPPLPLRAHLMVGLYQILDMEDVEVYAAVNETVDAVKAHFAQPQADFVNAILRRAAREKEILLKELQAESIGVQTSHSELLVSRWTAAFGADKTRALCEWNNRPAQVVVRISPSRIQMDDFLDRLASSGMRGEAHPFCPDHFATLPRGVAPARVPGYEDGWFSVQDPSTFMAVQLLAPQPRERVLDACAAPGGKLMAMAEMMGGGETLVAMDVHNERLAILKDNLKRMGWGDGVVGRGDMTHGGGVKELEGRVFDAILLDVPCTNTGVLRRRADARWRFSMESMGRVNVTQRAILDAASMYVRNGGRMVYSTCSLEPEEDEMLVAGWLASHPSFELAKQSKLFPAVDGVDGAYAALLVRR